MFRKGEKKGALWQIQLLLFFLLSPFIFCTSLFSLKSILNSKYNMYYFREKKGGLYGK